MIYVSSACICQHNIRDVIQQLAEGGIRNIELSGGTDYYDGIEQDLSILKSKYYLNYVCHAYFPPAKENFVVNLASGNDEIYQKSIEHYVNCIQMLRRIKCEVLSIHAGFFIEVNKDEIGQKLSSKIIYDEAESYDRFCTAYNYIHKLCKNNGIKLFLENNVLSIENYSEFNNHNYMMMTDYASIMRMKKQLDFNLLLDLGHLYVSANTLGLDYIDECRKLETYIKWLHISENNGISDEHRPLEKDSIILKQLYKLYTPNINVTLETKGDISDIRKGITLIKGGI